MFAHLNEFHGSLICNEHLQGLSQRVPNTGTKDSRRFNNGMVPAHPLRFISINLAPGRKEVRVCSESALVRRHRGSVSGGYFFPRGAVTKWSMPRGKRSVVFPGEAETLRGRVRCFHTCDDLLGITVQSVGHTQVQTRVTLLRGPGQDPVTRSHLQ